MQEQWVLHALDHWQPSQGKSSWPPQASLLYTHKTAFVTACGSKAGLFFTHSKGLVQAAMLFLTALQLSKANSLKFHVKIKIFFFFFKMILPRKRLSQSKDQQASRGAPSLCKQVK